MENVKYYKDLNHNYLIIKSNAGEGKQSYQHKMITANRMKRLLACKIRNVDEECHFYYEISSRQNMTALFDKRAIGYGQLQRLFGHMREALAELDGYLLDSRCLALKPEYIYGNPETEEYFFLYYPYYAEEENAYMALAEFLVEKVDHEQEEASAIVYQIYEMAQDNEFILPKILDLFSGTKPEEEETAEEITDRPAGPDRTAVTEDMVFPIGREEEYEGYNGEERMPAHLTAAGILAFACMAAAAGVFGIRYFFVLSMEEMVVSMAGGIVLIILSAFLFLRLIFNICGRGRKGKKEGRGEGKREDGVSGPVGVIPAADAYAVPVSRDKCDKAPVYSHPVKTAHQAGAVDGMGEEYGNTVFLEDTVCKTEHKLYGTNKGNKYHIDLKRLPCTVGKMAGSVDVVIKDSTVSRIHARFTRQEDGICVTDMNSTNGTFKNGLRLEPNETVLIERGDELRFGKMTFCYR